jgi:thiamine-phosphate pyrophosphorylase
MAVGADGVHLGTEDLPVSVARRIAGKNFIIGASVSSPEEALLAEKEGADYISAQSIFRTSSKENVKIIGLEGLRSIINASSLPVIAIGGINKDNVKDVIRNGAKGIAVISAAVSEEDVKKAVEELRESLEEVL